MSDLGSDLGGDLFIESGIPSLVMAPPAGALTGWRCVLYTGDNPDDAHSWVWNRDIPAFSQGTEITSAVIPLVRSIAGVKGAVQAIYWGSRPGPWRSTDGSVTIDPETTTLSTEDTVARDSAAQALELADSKTKVFFTNAAPTNPTGGYTLKAGDQWFNQDTTTACPDTNCKGHVLNASGDPMVGVYAHRGTGWLHKWDGSAWKDAQRNALVAASEISADAAVFNRVVSNRITTSNLQVGVITDNLFPNGNSEAAPPLGADATTAEWAWRYSDGGVYSGSWARSKIAGAAAEYLYVTVPCSPGDSFYVSAMCARGAGGSNQAGVFIHYKNADPLNGGVGTLLQQHTAGTTNATWTKCETSGTAPAGTTKAVIGIAVGAYSTGYWDAIYARRMTDGSLLAVDALQTSNYAEDGSGVPTAGAKLDHTGTALKVAKGNLQIGAHVYAERLRYVGSVTLTAAATATFDLFDWTDGDTLVLAAQPADYTGTPAAGAFTVKRVYASLAQLVGGRNRWIQGTIELAAAPGGTASVTYNITLQRLGA